MLTLRACCFLSRWNSVYIQLESIIKQRAAVVQTLNNVKDAPVNFTNQDWELMIKVKLVLQPFFEVTKMLSNRDASISMAIPVVTLIMKSLEEKPREDQGVLGMKRALKDEMDEMFSSIEEEEHYTVSTLLDSRYKAAFFQNPDTRDEAHRVVLEKLIEILREDENQVGGISTALPDAILLTK